VSTQTKIAIIGSGPAGLMAATQLALSSKASTLEIHLFEKRAGYGRKLLIAGSSGLNISHEHSIIDFSSHYEGWDAEYWKKMLTSFGPKEWISFIETKLGMETFLGTSNRYFVKEMKASNLLKKWIQFLEENGVRLHSQSELSDFKLINGKISLTFNVNETTTQEFDRAAFFLGGGSWEDEIPSWFSLFRNKKIKMIPFEPSNVGFEVAWSEKFLKEAEGKPLKKIELQTTRGEKMGELVITNYGLEGTPIYFCGIKGTAFLDLKPDLTEEQILNKLLSMKENFSPMRRVKHQLGLCEASESLLFHHSTADAKTDLKLLVSLVKKFPLELLNPRSLSESISSKGGVSLDEISPSLELKKFQGIFCGGEMLDWDAPTGGFLIQACVSQGAAIAKSLLSTI
jgi:uncharacterized flavoprotein (TIGR03862 family)